MLTARLGLLSVVSLEVYEMGLDALARRIWWLRLRLWMRARETP